jgi:hypothetical protein
VDGQLPVERPFADSQLRGQRPAVAAMVRQRPLQIAQPRRFQRHDVIHARHACPLMAVHVFNACHKIDLFF